MTTDQLANIILPPAGTQRWVAKRKAQVVRAITQKIISRAWAMKTYNLSEDELEGWILLIPSVGYSPYHASLGY